jgi:hypothetical protein
MKANNRVFQFVKQHPLACIITLSALILLGLFAVFGVQFPFDSYTYYIAWDYILSGKLDAFRTPSYPVFLGVCHAIFGNYGDVVAILVQILVFLLSIKGFWKLASYLSKNRKIIIATTAVYGLVPGIATYALIPLTELFAMCGVIFLLVLLLRMDEHLKVTDAIGFLLLLIFLIFLRPALLFLFVVMGAIALLWLFQKKIKNGLIVLGSMAVTLCLLWGYHNEISKEYNISAISCVSIANDSGIILYDSILYNRVCPTEITLEDAMKHRHSLDPNEYALYLTDMPLKEKFVKEVKSKLGIEWYVRAYYRVLDSGNYPMFQNYVCESLTLNKTQHRITDVWRTVEQRLPLRLNLFWYILILYTGLLLVKLWTSKSLNWYHWALCLSCWGQMAIMYIGAGADYTRLFVPTAPLIFLLTAHIVSVICSKWNINKIV